MTLWGKTFKRIPDERRNNQYAHRSHEEVCRDLSNAFDQMWVMKWIIGALCAIVTAQSAVVGWLWTHFWDCFQAAHRMAALVR